jgi:hypothetical protein
MRKIALVCVVFVLPLILAGCTASDGGQNAAEKPGKVLGSCNLVADTSTCVDYIGSYFKDYKNIALHCSDSRGTPSKDACPYPDFGGCRNGAGTDVENIIWAYATGGGEFDAETAGYFQKSCEAVGSLWTMPQY